MPRTPPPQLCKTSLPNLCANLCAKHPNLRTKRPNLRANQTIGTLTIHFTLIIFHEALFETLCLRSDKLENE